MALNWLGMVKYRATKRWSRQFYVRAATSPSESA